VDTVGGPSVGAVGGCLGQLVDTKVGRRRLPPCEHKGGDFDGDLYSFPSLHALTSLRLDLSLKPTPHVHV